MSKKAARDSPEGLKKRVDALLKLPENQTCADCFQKQPRWASSKLGMFMCIECSGIHRNLGTHISFVRSVNLDSWTVAQVEMMEEWGNARCKAYYEAEVPASYQRPVEGAGVRDVQRWIKDKYEFKRFVPKDGSIPPSGSTYEPSNHQTAHPVVTAPKATNGVATAPANRQAPAAATAAAVTKPASTDLLDFFGSADSAPVPPASGASFGHFQSSTQTQHLAPTVQLDPFSQQQTQQPSPQLQSAPGAWLTAPLPPARSEQPVDTSAIMSMFNAPSPALAYGMQGQQMQMQQMAYMQQQQQQQQQQQMFMQQQPQFQQAQQYSGMPMQFSSFQQMPSYPLPGVQQVAHGQHTQAQLGQVQYGGQHYFPQQGMSYFGANGM